MNLHCLLVIALAGCCPTPIAPVAPAAPAAPSPPPVAVVVPVDAAPAGPPIARTVDVVDHEFGLEVADPYRWMEGTDNAELAGWLRAQGEHAAAELARIPARDKLHARIRELGLGVTAAFDVQLGGGRMFHKVLAAGEQLEQLAVREPDGTERILVDPKALGGPGTHASLNAYSPSPDGKRVAYVIALGGGEQGKLHIMDVATGKDLPDVIDRIWGEGAASWLPDGKRLFYTQLAVPQPGVDPMTHQTAKLHVLGAPVADDVTILAAGGSLPLAPEEWPGLWVPPGSSWVLAFVGGAHSEQRVAVAKLSELGPAMKWRVVADYADAVESTVIHGDRIYLQTYKDAPNRKLVSVPLANPVLAKARLELAEDPDAAIAGTAAARDALYILKNVNGHARLLRWPWAGAATPLALPVDGWAPDLAADLQRDGLVFQLETWLAPGKYFVYEPKTGKVAPTGLASATTADVSQVVVDEVEVPSADGARVPLSILHAPGLALDGSHPTIVYGYAGYGASQYPGFSATRLAWIERGGVFAVAHVRGGGEKGRRWQDDGSREKKLNGINDFIACAEYLVAHKYTASSRLAAVGASMGGVLIGRVMTLRPDLFAAINIGAGIVDPLRILAAENGANQKAELGDPATEAGYRSIVAMDPYHHVALSTPYPAVIFTIGLNDHRVAPWMTGKLAARLIASSTSKRPILVRVDGDAGHGHGSTRDQTFAERADVWSFFLAELGDPEFRKPQ